MNDVAPSTRSSIVFNSRGSSLTSLGAERFAGFGVLESGDKNWRLHAEGSVFESSSVLRGTCPPGVATKGPGADPDLLTIGIVLRGQLDLTGTPGETLRLLPYECFHVRSAASCSLSRPKPSRFMLVTTSMAIVEEYGASIGGNCGRIEADRDLVRPVASFSESLVGRQVFDTDLTRCLLERLLQEQLGALLLSSEGHPEREASTSLSVYRQAKALIKAKHAEYGFTPTSLAVDIGVSLRLLQKVFAHHGETVADEIRNARTRHARLLLDNPRYSDLTRLQISNYAGFSSVQVMRRAPREADAREQNSMQTHP